MLAALFPNRSGGPLQIAAYSCVADYGGIRMAVDEIFEQGISTRSAGRAAAATSSDGGAEAPARLKRAIFEFFNKGAGSRLSAVFVDAHFLLWRLRHPHARFSDYYAGSIAAGLRRGRTHKTLGDKRFLSGSAFTGAATIDPSTSRSRGAKYLEMALEYGLRPEHSVIDYGCGSLRVGQQLIGYLEPGKYCGLDIVSDFYEAGAKLLPQGTIEARQPQLQVICPQTLDAAKAMQPDFVFSVAVLKHVPPTELEGYFRNIAHMMAPRSRAVITFKQSDRSARTGAKIWNYSADEIVAKIDNLGSGLRCAIHPFRAGPDADVLPRTSVLLIERE